MVSNSHAITKNNIIVVRLRTNFQGQNYPLVNWTLYRYPIRATGAFLQHVADERGTKRYVVHTIYTHILLCEKIQIQFYNDLNIRVHCTLGNKYRTNTKGKTVNRDDDKKYVFSSVHRSKRLHG